MATKAHCAYCFEILAASFEHRQPLKLRQVEELWEAYQASSSTDGEEDELEDDESEDAEMVDAGADTAATAARPAAISKLLHRETAPSAGSSSSSLPSTRSTTSSTPNSESGVNTPATSQSSLPSLARESRTRREEYPLFVTWNTISKTGHKSLRGCIGTFEPRELEYGLRSYAITSAFEDTRFHPIPSSEFPSLACHVTLLTNFSEPTKDPMDWTLGKHGIRISFSHHGRRYGATYLPDVAKEQGWTKEETLISLMRKAGWSGSGSGWLRTWKDGRGELVRYEGKQVALEYPDWREWRDWVQKEGV
ncbi:ammecr1 protein [Teratosphaeria destructans]|uniref:Ammecr1 protein n=1 Tax=Teratosphaeria destructans TaxID=418781 RepID=A0A9W7W3F4_9PEZI|nr:ammecr1 protein [Teratosphaeria destructans]